MEKNKNDRFILWLRENLGDHYKLSANQQSDTGTARFSRSKLDFSFYRTDFGVSSSGAAISEYVELECEAGDCNGRVANSDTNQLIANMQLILFMMQYGKES